VDHTPRSRKETAQSSAKGNRYLRVLFVQAVVPIKPQTWERYALKQWISAAKGRLHFAVLAIALADKLARIAWAILSKEGARVVAVVKTSDYSRSNRNGGRFNGAQPHCFASIWYGNLRIEAALSRSDWIMLHCKRSRVGEPPRAARILPEAIRPLFTGPRPVRAGERLRGLGAPGYTSRPSSPDQAFHRIRVGGAVGSS
jgi:hypothetical protein